MCIQFTEKLKDTYRHLHIHKYLDMQYISMHVRRHRIMCSHTQKDVRMYALTYMKIAHSFPTIAYLSKTHCKHATVTSYA